MALDLVITSLFDDPHLAIEAMYAPKNSDMRPIRLIRRKPTEVIGFETTPIATDTFKFRARASDFTKEDPPMIGDEIQFFASDGEVGEYLTVAHAIQSDPILSASGLTWSLDTRRVWALWQ